LDESFENLFKNPQSLKKVQIYWQGDLMAIKKSYVACVHRRTISQYDSGERCGPWASCLKKFSSQKLLGQKSSKLFGSFNPVHKG
jgi:hypothetical protein